METEVENATSAISVVAPSPNPPIPKISLLRRESASGPTWMKTTAAITPITESSISSMFNVIRATFRQNIIGAAGEAQFVAAAGAAVREIEKAKECESSKEAGQMSGLAARSSSATRGRGLQRAKKNQN